MRRGPTATDRTSVLPAGPTVPGPRERDQGTAKGPQDEPCRSEKAAVPLSDVRCFVVDGSPAYRSGLCGALIQAGLSAEAVDDVTSLPRQVALGGAAVVHTMRSASAPRPHLPLDAGLLVTVGLLPGEAAGDYAEALRRGWDAVVFRDAPLSEIVVVVREAVGNRTVLPAAVAHDLAAHMHGDPHGLSPEQVEWVRFLAAGGTISALAQKFTFSEREMHRRLNVVYRRLQASNKVEALLEASKRGLV